MSNSFLKQQVVDLFHAIRPNSRIERQFHLRDAEEQRLSAAKATNTAKHIFTRDYRWKRIKLPKEERARYESVVDYFTQKGFQEAGANLLATHTQDIWKKKVRNLDLFFEQEDQKEKNHEKTRSDSPQRYKKT